MKHGRHVLLGILIFVALQASVVGASASGLMDRPEVMEDLICRLPESALRALEKAFIIPDWGLPGRASGAPLEPPDWLCSEKLTETPLGPPYWAPAGKPDETPVGPPDWVSVGRPDDVEIGPPSWAPLGKPEAIPVGPPG
jgi:hypothetical protein